MSTDDPPNNYFNGIGYNPLFYVKDTGTGLTQEQTDLLYLSKNNSDTSTAPLTTFNGEINILSNTTIGVRGVSGGILNLYRRMRIWDINNVSATNADFFSTGTDMQYSTLNNGGGLETFHRFYTCPSTSSTASLNLEVGNTMTRIYNGIDVGTFGVNKTSYFRHPIQMFDAFSPYTNYNQLLITGNTALYNMTGTLTNHRFTTTNSVPTQITSLDIQSTQNISRVPLTITEGELTPSTTLSQSGNNTLINNNNNSGQIIFNARSSGGTPLDVMSLEQTQITANVPIIYKANAIQYTEVKQSTQIFQINNKSVSRSINFSTQTAGGLDTQCASINTSGFTIPTGITFYTRSIRSVATTSNHALFDNIGAGSTLTIATASCVTTFNGITTYPFGTKI